MRASSSAVKVSWRCCTIIHRLRRACGPSSVTPPLPPSPEAPVNTDRSMPAQKCLPVDEITIARALAPASISRTISGSSVQNAGIIVLSSSGRFSWRWATLSSMVTSKHSGTPRR